MAEIAMGSIALVFPAVKLVKDSKHLIDEWRDVPDNIEYMLADLAGWQSFLVIAKSTFEQYSGSQTLQTQAIKNCLDDCFKCMDPLQRLLTRLKIDLEKNRQIGKLKGMSKAQEIFKIRSRFAETLSRLQMHYSSAQFSMTLMASLIGAQTQQSLDDSDEAAEINNLQASSTHHQYRDVQTLSLCADKSVQRIELVKTSHCICCSAKEMDTSRNIRTRRRRRSNHTSFNNLNPPTQSIGAQIAWWLSVSYLKARRDGLLGFVTKNYRFHSRNTSVIVKYIKSGNSFKLRNMFDNQEATPNDVIVFEDDGFGPHTLLQYAAYQSQPKICQLLIATGSQCESPDDGLSGLSNFRGSGSLMQTTVKIAQILSAHIDLFDFFATWQSNSVALSLSSGSVIRQIFQQARLSYTDWSIESRLEFLLSLDGRITPDYPRTVRTFLEGYLFDARICALQDHSGKTFLLEVAYQLGSHISFEFESYANTLGHDSRLTNANRFSYYLIDTSLLDARLDLIYDLVQGGSFLHQIGRCGIGALSRTPFSAIISGVIDHTSYHRRNIPYHILINICAQLWVAELAAAGVNLIEYGQETEEIWKRNTSFTKQYTVPGISKLRYAAFAPSRHFQFIGFEYGAQPSEWNIRIIETSNIKYTAFREFWEMVAYPERAIPGFLMDNVIYDDAYETWLEEDNEWSYIFRDLLMHLAQNGER